MSPKFLLSALVLAILPTSFSLVSEAKEPSNQDGRSGNWKTSAQGAPALEAAKKRVADHPDDAIAQNDLGWALRQNGDGKSAEAALRLSIKLNPNLAYAHSNLSVVLLDAGQKDEALIEGNKAVALDAKVPIYHVVLGNAMSANGDIKSAINEYKAAIALRADYEDAYYNLGRVLDLDGQQTEAKVILSQAINLDPADDRVMKLLDQLMK